MATTLKNTNDLFHETIADVSKDSRSWQAFLKTASLNYKYDFTDQLLIYAQKPTATACADYDTWNNHLNRYINANTNGIALLTEVNGIPRLRYVWDLSDTHSKYGRKSKKVKLWEVDKIYEEQVIEALENRYGEIEDKNNLGNSILSVAKNLVEDNYLDYYEDLLDNLQYTRLENIEHEVIKSHYLKLLTNSVGFMIMNRCGIDPSKYYISTDFDSITLFQDMITITRVGSSASEISEMGLREIYNIIKNIRNQEIEKIYTFEKNEKIIYDYGAKSERSDFDEHNLYENRQLESTQPDYQRKEESTTREIFSDEARVLEELQEESIQDNVDGRYPNGTLGGNRSDSSSESYNYRGSNEETRELDRRIESQRSNNLGGQDEQLEDSSRRNSDERANLQLENDENTDNGILFSSNEYNYKPGDKVYIGLDEYEIEKVGLFDIELYNPETPLFGRTMNKVEFETKLKENPANDHLKIENQKDIKVYEPDNYYGEYNDEIDLIDHILSKHKIDDIIMDFNDDGIIIANDEEGNVWEGKEFYDFLFNDLFNYNNDGTVDLIDNRDLERLKECRKKYEITSEVDIPPTEKENIVDKAPSYEQTSLFATREQELADRILEIFNSFDTKWKGTFEISGVELKVWDHISSKKRNLSIILSSPIADMKDNAFSYFNTDKTDENILLDGIANDKFLQYLNADKDFSIYMSPNLIHIYYHNFDEKQIDLSVGKDNILKSINDKENVEVIDDNEILPVPKKVRKPKILNYVLHPEVPYEERINYKIKDDYLGVGTPKERYKNNIEAIKVIKKCEEENRYATAEEQEILSKYVGWGGLSEAFREDGSWGYEYQELKQLLNEEEYNLAMDSTLTAFYTPPIVINAMYKALTNMGLNKGNILEPACGIGNFIGMLPNNDNLKIYGVEKDDISGNIARQLYQKSSIAINGFENVDYSDSFFDCVVGNVPFGDIPINDKRYNKNHFVIHDYFFAKTIDKVRPGGIIALITSQGTLDKENSNVRRYIASRADLIGAIRLPNDTFKSSAGTTVTSDIIFLQKRDSITDIMPSWVNVDHNEDGLLINNYFIEHPEQVLGRYELISTQFGMKPACLPYEDKDLGELLDNAIKNIKAEIKEAELDETDLEEDLSIEADLNVNNFSYTLVDDKVYYRENSRMYPQELALTAENRVKGLIKLRDTTRELINLQLEDYPDEYIIEKQQELNDLYDNFTKKYGFINSRANASVFNNDNSYYLLCSLEILDENGNLLRKADMFSKRTIKAERQHINVDNAYDALIVSIGEKAKVDIPFMQSLCGLDTDKMIKDLEGIIFRVPIYGDPNTWVTADEYLSGNIREKLAIAKEFSKNDSSYNVNVKYLEEAMPEPLKASEISVRIGTTWIPKEYYEEFMFELFDTDYYKSRKIKLNYSDVSGEYNIENKSADNYNEKVITTYGTKRINGYHIFEESLNLRDVKIYDYYIDDNGKRKQKLNGKETAIAQAKQEQIRQAFLDWIWKDPTRRQELETIYNERFNSVRPREFNGDHIVFHGMNPEITLRKHQLDAIAGILYGNNRLLAHEVGAGKTFEMVAGAMESKALGLCNKSLIVVPNHIVEQFASEFLQLYPAANILVATKKDFETANRKKFCSRIATGEYDAVIIGHSQFEKIPMSIERQITLLNQELQEIMSGIEEAKYMGATFTTKQLMKTKKSLEVKLDKLNNTDRKDDNVVTFEQLGVDRLFIDEAHYFKNLFLYTKMSNVAGIGQSEAQKSSDLYMKCKYLDEITDNKGIVFATGTPVSNSMVELYTMMRYLQTPLLHKLHLQNFDAWASTFGETTTAIELAPEGNGYRAKTRFAKFYNLPELISLFKESADIKTADMLNLPVPEAKYETVVVEPSEIQVKMVEELGKRAEKIREHTVDPHEDNMLKITNDGKKLALDQRLMNELLPDNDKSKANRCANNVYKLYEESNDIKGTQLVFCDLSTPKGDGKFNVYYDLKSKLIAKGIPEEEIKFIHEADSEQKKKDLFAKVRKGQVRVLLGSTSKMGAGTNCQDRLVAIHHLDCPWKPAELVQRNGRGIRQGNMNKLIHIFNYVTEKTFDAYLYQLVENKQKFISQIMTSKTPLRSASDVDETVLSYAEIKALAAGNPLILEKTELESKVSKLKLLKQSHLSQIYELEDKITKTYPQDIKVTENSIYDIEQDLKVLEENQKEMFDGFSKMELNNILYTDKKEAGTRLLEIIKENTDLENEVQIGNYMGFNMSLGFNFLTKGYYISLKNHHTYYADLSSDVLGNITRINNELDRLPNYLENNKEKLETLKQQFEVAKEEAKKPFLQEQELKDAIKRLKEVDTALKIDDKVKEVIDDFQTKEDSQIYKNDYER